MLPSTRNPSRPARSSESGQADMRRAWVLPPLGQDARPHPNLARSITDSGWSAFTQQVTDKVSWYDNVVSRADGFFFSNQLRSSYKARGQRRPLKERQFHCATCGHSANRSGNAATCSAPFPEYDNGASQRLGCPYDLGGRSTGRGRNRAAYLRPAQRSGHLFVQGVEQAREGAGLTASPAGGGIGHAHAAHGVDVGQALGGIAPGSTLLAQADGL